ncbi:MAG: sigma-54 dependent transcriptional regulator [Candidatus Zixiibacteriota bacterium]
MNQKPTILVISSDDSLYPRITDILSDLNLESALAPDCTKGLKQIREKSLDFVLLDSRMKDLPCENLIRRIANKSPSAEILAVKDEETDAEILISAGADEILNLPLDPEEIHTKIKKIKNERDFLISCDLIGKSAELKRIAETIMQVAPTNITVLITGESGTGKELIARAIHHNSLRGGNPFIAANTGALAEGVLESELFGHEKGAFTGAIARRQGLFERADRGTIFLDEIAEIPLSTQVKLLRVLEERSFLRVGGTQDVKVDVRVIAATNKDIEQSVREGSFRDDLYYRLAVVKIDVPPLRERIKDIPILVHDFIGKLNAESTRKIKGVTDEAMDILLRYHWPGNVRELRNFLESTLVLAPDQVIEAQMVRRYVDEKLQSQRQLPVVTGKSVQTAEHELIYQAILSLRQEILHLRKALFSQGELKPEYFVDIEKPWEKESRLKEVLPPQSMEEMEKELIEKTLGETGGNRRKAARILGIGERTLYRKINKYGLRELR